jgi:hypothetical protein
MATRRVQFGQIADTVLKVDKQSTLDVAMDYPFSPSPNAPCIRFF